MSNDPGHFHGTVSRTERGALRSKDKFRDCCIVLERRQRQGKIRPPGLWQQQKNNVTAGNRKLCILGNVAPSVPYNRWHAKIAPSSYKKGL
eukprot:scaffold14974_cov195-Amphora_coffeaeformis.AAC.22